MINDEDAMQWERMIAGVVRKKIVSFPDVDREDLHQEVWVRLLSESRQFYPDEQGVRGLIHRWAKEAAGNIRADNLYNSAQYFYTPNDIRLILLTTFHSGEWGEGYVPKDARSFDDTWTDSSDVRSDVAAAWKGLHKTYKVAIFRRYALEEIPEDSSAQEKRLNRGIERLTDLINWYYRSQSYRRARSNASSRALIEDQEEN